MHGGSHEHNKMPSLKIAGRGGMNVKLEEINFGFLIDLGLHKALKLQRLE